MATGWNIVLSVLAPLFYVAIWGILVWTIRWVAEHS